MQMEKKEIRGEKERKNFFLPSALLCATELTATKKFTLRNFHAYIFHGGKLKLVAKCRQMNKLSCGKKNGG